jgi:outer membrane murein-binding lipoprotein Lpp
LRENKRMPKLNENEWIGVFKAGDYGYKGKYTVADVEEMATHYDPQYRKAPVIIGHPGGFFGGKEQPAHGWVEKVKAAAGVLYARFGELSDELKEGIKTGKYKGRSASIMPAKYSDTGQNELFHVALLGESTPRVSGLLPAFAEQPEKLIELEYNENEEVAEEGQETELEEIEKLETNPDKGVQDMDKLEELEGKIAQLSTQVNQLSARPDISEEELATLKTKADKAQELETSNEKLSTELAGLHEEDVKREVSTLFSALRKIGQLTPALEHTGLEDAMIRLKQLSADGNGACSITLGGKDVSLYDAFSSFLEALPQIVPMGEVAPEGDGSSGPSELEERPGYIEGADEESNKISTRAYELMAKDEYLSLEDAQDKAYKEVHVGS